MPSSRVGAITSISGPSPLCSGGWAMMCSRPGMPKAKVLPEPVFATPTMSRPAMAGPQPWDWMAVGKAKPWRAKLSSMNWGKPVSWNVRIGLGTLSPQTVMLWLARHWATSSTLRACAADMNWPEIWPFCSSVSCDHSMSRRLAPKSENPALGISPKPPPLSAPCWPGWLNPPLPWPPLPKPPLPKPPLPLPPSALPPPLLPHPKPELTPPSPELPPKPWLLYPFPPAKPELLSPSPVLLGATA
mmetsp:Transcript_80392/g.206901  ORF Transcript_80392/g.206901 Transcript_80392/m.206901 type:complete len:244 (-) Transcript_80392:285-1016(-)